MARKEKHKKSDSCIADVISMAISSFEDLGSAMRDWFDNCSENLQQSDKMQTVDQTASDLEGISEPDIPDWAGALRFDLIENNYTPRQSQKLSRSAIRDDAVWFLQQVVERLDVEEGKLDAEKDEEKVDEITSLRDDLQAIIDVGEGLEFPGMYG